MINLTRPSTILFPVLLLVALMMTFGLFTGNETQNAELRINRANAIIRELDRLLQQMLDAETGERGYLLSENELLLTPYELARRSYATTEEELRQRLSDDPKQLERLHDLHDSITLKLDEISKSLALSRAGHRDEAIANLRSGAGNRAMLDIRQHMAALENAERSELARQEAAADTARLRIKIVTYTAATLAALAAIFLVFVLSRDQKRRAAAAIELMRLKDEAQAASRAKSDFLATMSHEIRTPMNGIIGMNGLLLDTPLNAQQEQFAKGVQVSAENLLTIVNDILDISKLDAGRVEIESIDFSPISLIEGALDSFVVTAQRKGLEIAAVINPDVPGWVRGDPARLRQIILNLIGNALKFTAAGSIAVEASAEHGAEGGILTISVTDTGIGIPEAARAQLFEKFIQADSSITRRYGGTGLGLAICKQLAVLMGGEIGVDSAQGEGSRFWFTVRYGRPESEPALQLASQPELLKGRRVILLDDAAINRRAMSGQLESEGIVVTALGEPADLVPTLRAAAAAGDPFEVAILDQTMPGITGVALAREVRALPEFDTLKLILATSVGLPNPSDEARRAGFDDYLSKPLKRAPLVDSLCQVLDLKRADDAPQADIGPWAVGHGGHAASSANILVAEDNAINQQLITALLKKWGHRVTMAEDGYQAISAALDADYDLILMDIQMPGMSGIEASKRIREASGQRGATPIVALTAHVLAGTRDEALGAGIQDHVTKPIDPVELAIAINRWARKPSTPTAIAGVATGRENAASGTADIVLDIDMLTVLEEQIGRETVLELAAIFLDETPGKIAGIRRAVSDGELPTARRLAHDIRSTAGNMGMRALMSLARDMEQDCAGGRSDRLFDLTAAIERAYIAAAEPFSVRYEDGLQDDNDVLRAGSDR